MSSSCKMAYKTSIQSRRCQVCGAVENLLICSRCRTVFYCSKEHQKKHWKHHKKFCSKENLDTNNTGSGATTPTTTTKATVNAQQKVAQMKIDESENELAMTSTFLNRTTSGWEAIANNTSTSSKDEVTFTDRSNDVVGTSNKLNGENKSQQTNIETSYTNSSDKSHNSKQFNQQHMAYSFQQQKKVKIHSVYAEKFLSNTAQCQRMCEQIISDLNTYGICVLDKFLGEELGTLILEEVKVMYSSGVFKDGQLVSSKKKDSSTTIRGDKITWVEGVEEGCRHVGDLISIVDSLIAQCNKNRGNNGELGNYDIGGRTKAMVACYPGAGTHYVKHVDNPNHDGRCITSIYYLNKDWNEKRGGLLRIFPDGRDQVADIVPIFDRILFFWSDRRNPHEVQASFQTRYAITLWYFDQRERKLAMQQHHAAINPR